MDSYVGEKFNMGLAGHTPNTERNFVPKLLARHILHQISPIRLSDTL
jgi:hypothetical protein